MTPKEIAAQYEAKVFDAPEAAKVAGFVLTETMDRATFGTRPARRRRSSRGSQKNAPAARRKTLV